MTTDIRDTLHDIGASVAPPVLDRVAFEGHVRRARRRRRTGQVAVATAAAVVLGATAWLVAPGGSGGPELAGDPSTGDGGPSVLAFEQEGMLHLSRSRPDVVGLSRSTGIRVEEVVAQVPGGVVYVDQESHLKRVDTAGERVVGEPRDLVGPQAVQWARVDATGSQLWFVDLDDTLHRRALGASADEGSEALTPYTTVMAVGVDSWLDSDGEGTLVLHTPDGDHEIEPHGSAMSAQIGGTTLAVHTDDGSEFWSTIDGERLPGSMGLGTAALSPDGRWLASGANDVDRDAGRAGLFVGDITRMESQPVLFEDDTGPIVDIWWADAEHYDVVVETNADGQLLHTLYECVVGNGCQYRIEDETGTLWLPRD